MISYRFFRTFTFLLRKTAFRINFCNYLLVKLLFDIFRQLISAKVEIPFRAFSFMFPAFISNNKRNFLTYLNKLFGVAVFQTWFWYCSSWTCPNFLHFKEKKVPEIADKRKWTLRFLRSAIKFVDYFGRKVIEYSYVHAQKICSEILLLYSCVMTTLKFKASKVSSWRKSSRMSALDVAWVWSRTENLRKQNILGKIAVSWDLIVAGISCSHLKLILLLRKSCLLTQKIYLTSGKMISLEVLFGRIQRSLPRFVFVQVCCLNIYLQHSFSPLSLTSLLMKWFFDQTPFL